MYKPKIMKLIKESDSTYSIVIAIAKRARDLVSNAEATGEPLEDKPVNIAIDEFAKNKYKVQEGENSEDKIG